MKSNTNVKEGYKKTAVGVIPEEWEVKKLKEVSAFRNGKAHESIVEEKADYILVNSRFVSTEGKIQKKVSDNLSPLFKEEIAIVMSDVPKGRAIAKCFYVEENNLYTLNQRIGGITAKGIESKFLFYQLNRNKYYLKFDNGVSQTNLRMNEVLGCPLKIPPLPEQQAIADCLTTWDKGIEKLSALIEAKKEQKKGLMQQLLTGKKRLDGFEGEWEKIKIEDLAIYRRGSFPQPYGLSKWYDDENGMPFVQVYDVDDNFKLKKDTKRKISKLAEEKSVFIPKGTLIVTIQGSIGRVAITDYDAYIDRTLLLFTEFKKEVNKYFIMHQLYRLFYLEKQRAPGGTIKTITIKVLSKFKVALPSKKEQTAIANILSTTDQEIALLEKKLEAMKEEKKGLMQVLLTGDKRLIDS